MKSWKDPRSPWGRQIRFDDHEFESMMDEMRERTGSDGFVTGKGIDVELVLLRAIGAEADYVDLPANILGRTLFAEDGSVRIEVSRSLSDEAEVDRTARRRLRTTIAHECGHVICHQPLFIRDTESLSLFSESLTTKNTAARPPIMCRSEGVTGVGYRGEWWEFQANRCMAALLLPRRMVGDSVRRRLADGGFRTGEECVLRGAGHLLVEGLSDEYDVSQTATLYRLQSLGFIPDGTQHQMRLVD
ncbi:MAG: ImmA/IrrE family metallo-endopeptidase [Gemmatimonadales bacterium]